MRSRSPVPLFVGLGLVAVGLVAILVGWSRAAGTTEVTEQVPALILGGLVGIALVLIGLTLAAVQSRRLEGAQQAEQVVQVAAAIAALREAIVPTDDDELSLGHRATPEVAPTTHVDSSAAEAGGRATSFAAADAPTPEVTADEHAVAMTDAPAAPTVRTVRRTVQRVRPAAQDPTADA